MGIDHTKPAYTDEAAPLIEERGGKIGGLEYLRSKGGIFEKVILPSQVLLLDEEWHGPTVEPGPKDKYIVRASHPHDFQGLVDVIDTKVVDKDADIGAVIGKMREHAKSALVMSYGQYENPAYDGNIRIGIQPYVTNRRGNIVEHPNRPGEYVISYVSPGTSKSGLEISTTIFNAGKQHFVWGLVGWEEKSAQTLVDLYRSVEHADLVQDDTSFQMEFVERNESVIITQVRAFIKKQIATFTLDGQERLVFGVTGPEGIELPVLHSPTYFDCDNKTPLSHHEPWAFIKTQHDAAPPLNFQPRNMNAYLISQSWASGLTSSLEHNHFRFAQKADVTVFEEYMNFRHDFSRILFGDGGPGYMELVMKRLEKTTSDQAHYFLMQLQMLRRNAGLLSTKARIISDGRTATVHPVYDIDPGEFEDPVE